MNHKSNKFALIIGLAVILAVAFGAVGCSRKSASTLEIVRKVYEYEKSNWEFKFELDNVGNSDKISDLVNKLVYNNLGFDEYVSNIEESVIEPMDDFQPDDPRISSLNESYTIRYADTQYIIISHYHYEFYAYAAHPNYWYDCFVIDVSEERLLPIDELIKPIPENVLLDLIKKQYEEYFEIEMDDFFRDTIWPPSMIDVDGENTILRWNTYTLLPHAAGPVEVSDYKIISQYLTAKGKTIIKLDTSTAPQAKTDTVTVSPASSQAAAASVFEFSNGAITSDNGGMITAYNGTDKTVVIPAQIQGQAVIEIAHRSFQNKQLTGVTFPNSIAMIWEYAFAGNLLTNVAFPGSVRYINHEAFKDNPLTSITIGADVELGLTPGLGQTGFAFSETFDATYNNNGKQAGTYTLSNGVWSLGGTPLQSGIIDKSDYLCADNEDILIGFKMENSSKVVSVCIEKNDAYIVYRFGTRENIELEFPQNKADSWAKFAYEWSWGQIYKSYSITFKNGGYSYSVNYDLDFDFYQNFQRINCWINVRNISTEQATRITGVSESIIGGLADLPDNVEDYKDSRQVERLIKNKKLVKIDWGNGNFEPENKKEFY